MVAVAAGFLVVGALQQAGAQAEAGEMNQQIAHRNAGIREQAAKDSTHLGAERANLVRINAQRIQSEQTAAFAGQGVDTSFGSSDDIAFQVDMQSELEVDTIINNAKLEAWGIRTEATSIRFGGDVAAAAGANNAFGTALTGIGQGAAVFATAPAAAGSAAAAPANPNIVQF